MAEITATLVKDLRTQTGAGMMDCKKALTETDGDLEAAVDWLRQKGLSQAAKKAGREAAEGLVGVAVSGGVGAVVEVNSETDFVARNEDFQNFVRTVADLAVAAKGDMDALTAAPIRIAAGMSATSSPIWSRPLARICASAARRPSRPIRASWPSMSTARRPPASAGSASSWRSKSSGDAAKLEEAGKQLAMHIAAANPRAVTSAEIDPEVVEHERKILTAKAEESGRPPEIIQKMVEGGIRKFYEEAALMDQVWVIDGKTRVNKVLEQLAKDVGAPVEVAGFVRYALGEGIERKEADFAAEVAAAAGS